MDWHIKTKEEKREHLLKMNLNDNDKEIVEFDKIAITTLDILYSKYSGQKLKEKKRYTPKYIDHKEY
tara:strand:+ start:3424 stop:3624 length:201 start_codon:yes stop_codon:yes gene_type:complete